MSTDIKLAQVIIDARDQNGWHVIGAISLPHDPGVRPNGVIAFTDPHKAMLRAQGFGPRNLGICGTARFYVREDLETVFHTGNYDLRRDDAMADLAARGEIACDPPIGKEAINR